MPRADPFDTSGPLPKEAAAEARTSAGASGWSSAAAGEERPWAAKRADWLAVPHSGLRKAAMLAAREMVLPTALAAKVAERASWASSLRSRLRRTQRTMGRAMAFTTSLNCGRMERA